MKNRRLRDWRWALSSATCVIAAVSLSACGTLSNAYAPNKLNSVQLANPSAGIVLLSTGADHECVSFSTFFMLHKRGERYPRGSGALVPVDAYTMKSDLNEGIGFVSAISLAPGDYFFSPWLANPYFSATRSPRYDFSVAAGEVVYLGEYHQPGRCVSGEGNITDQWSRDKAFVEAGNPNIDLSSVKMRLLRYSGDAVTGEDAPPPERFKSSPP